MSRSVLLAILAAAALPAAEHKLAVSPDTIAWGYYWAGAKPALTVKSGDLVEIQTVSGVPERLEAAGLPPDQIEPELRALYQKVPKEARGPGGHLLTGPIAIEGAQPGDVLEVRIREIRMNVPYSYNNYGRASGFLPNEFEPQMKIVPLDRARLVGHFTPGIDIPLKPFFGSMGVAPPESAGKINSAPPGMHAGNLDNKELVAGTTLFIPVHAPGALFEVGDGHAAMGNGEVDITALETSLTGVFQFIVRHDMHLRWPRAETPTHYITMGLDPDLTEATRLAVHETIDFLTHEKKLTPGDAYMLASVAVDFAITQLVDGTKGVHGMIPKSIFNEAAKLADTDDLRISTLPELAAAEFEAGDVAAAERDARQLLRLASAYSKEWNHDELAHAANTVLGRVSLKRGDLEEAKERLLASARVQTSPGSSPVLRSFGPSMRLAQELLVAGERDVVLRYLELCRMFWKNDRGRIDRYVDLIKSEAAPNLLSPYMGQGPPLAGAKAPPFRLKDLAGKEWALDQLSGKVVALDFWTTWCRQCLDELPALEKLDQEFRQHGAMVLAVDVGEDAATVRGFIGKNQVTLPVLLAGEDAMILNYQVEAYPTLVVIDRDGRVAEYRVGASSEADLREAIEKSVTATH